MATVTENAAADLAPIAGPIADQLSRVRTQATHQRCDDIMKADCESHVFYGTPQSVMNKLASLPDGLKERRVYMLLIDSAHRAEVRVFERYNIEDREGTLAIWRGESLGDLNERIADAILSNGGLHCPGEQVKSALGFEGNRSFSAEGAVPLAMSAGAAFAEPVAAFADERFVRVEAVFLC